MKQFIVITTPQILPCEGIRLTRLFEEGLKRLHLRKPNEDSQTIAKLLDAIPTIYHERITLHDHFELTETYAIGGLHLNSRQNIIPNDFHGRISRSCHSIEELAQYPTLDYLFLSPIFPSISKEGYGTGFPAEALQKASQKGQIHEQIIALGGIDKEKIAQLRPYPFGGIAVLGALWGRRPEREKTEMMVSRYKQLYHAYINDTNSAR